MSRDARGAAFWIDREYDRDSASDGVSRLGAYIRQSELVAECWKYDDDERERAEWFAVSAWRTACTPVMSPGYVRRHPVIRSADVARQQEGAPLSGIVDLASPLPAALAHSRDWRGGRPWQEWPTDSLGGWRYDPAEEGMILGRHLALTTTRLEFPLGVHLWAAPTGPDEAARLALDVIRDLVVAMNEVVTPAISTLERS